VALEVVPCCVDLDRVPPPSARSRVAAKALFGLEDRRVVLYVGSTTGFYLFDEMVDFVLALRAVDPNTYFAVLTQRDVDRVTERLRGRGLGPDDCSVRSVSPSDVAGHSAAADIALSFITPTYSKSASSPTKIAEYLAAGLPVVANAGVGDLDEQLGEDRVGVLVTALTADGYARAIDELDALAAQPDLARRCRASAERRFDLASVGGPRYVELYRRLLLGAAP
jgi:glycosyltransferase involved in cell wall biosynthesis